MADETWTEERVALLKHGWVGQKLTARAIAAQLGPPFTRSAVIGKAHRLGLGSERRCLSPAAEAAIAAARGAKVAAARSKRFAGAAAGKVAAQPVTILVAIKPRPVAPDAARVVSAPRTGVLIFDLGPLGQACRFIEGRAAGPHETRYCNARTFAAGETYCAAHHALCVAGRVKLAA